MKQPRYDCDPEAVLDMQASHVGVEEILQYCQALLTTQEVKTIIDGLEALIERVGGGTDETSLSDLRLPSIFDMEEELVS